MEKAKILIEELSQYLKDENNLKIGEKCINYLKQKCFPEEKYSSFISDDIIYRFLAARDEKPEDTFKMWSEWVDWRIDYKPEEITEDEIKTELNSGKIFLHGCDMQGRPCIVMKHSKHIPEQSNFDEMIRCFIYILENACKLADEKGIKQICLIIDRENCGWANFDRRFLSKKNPITIFQDFYPERLHSIYVVSINWFFRSIFGMVKPLMAEKTKNKMKILSDLNELKNYFQKEDLLTEHGGSSSFVLKYS
jgi:hypothetical protein